MPSAIVSGQCDVENFPIVHIKPAHLFYFAFSVILDFHYANV